MVSASEHINRVHTRKYGCLECGHRFSVTKDDELDRSKTKHAETCKPRALNEFDPELMTEAQDDAWATLDCRGGQGRADEQKWKETIYLRLFPDTSADEVPRPCKCSLSQLSTFHYS
jgi:hypothetical protein